MKFKVKVQSGKGQYFKDFEDLYVEVDGEQVTFQDIYTKVKALEAKCDALERENREIHDYHKRIEEVLTSAVELLQKKVSRLEAASKKED